MDIHPSAYPTLCTTNLNHQMLSLQLLSVSNASKSSLLRYTLVFAGLASTHVATQGLVNVGLFRYKPVARYGQLAGNHS